MNNWPVYVNAATKMAIENVNLTGWPPQSRHNSKPRFPGRGLLVVMHVMGCARCCTPSAAIGMHRPKAVASVDRPASVGMAHATRRTDQRRGQHGHKCKLNGEGCGKKF